MNLGNIFSTVVDQNTIGGIILVAFVTMLGFLVKGMISNHGSISVAKIESETTLGSKAIETLTTALEVLQEENRTLKATHKQLEDEIDTLIHHILCMVKAASEPEMEKCRQRLEQFLRHAGRWPLD